MGNHLSLQAAHYIYTTLSVQYKRLFESAPAQRNQRSAAYERPFCRIDRNRRSGQDTGGFALAVGRLAVSRAPLKTGHRQYKVMRSASPARSLHTVQINDLLVTTDERSSPPAGVFRGALVPDEHQPPGSPRRLSFHRRVTRNP
ncbi:hypothetical protein C3E98_016315 [Pseudomonas sp. MWU13-2625]|nr:hypothetical protein C3E98_016315 [Pseudomonas sp. MWU13-2625]